MSRLAGGTQLTAHVQLATLLRGTRFSRAFRSFRTNLAFPMAGALTEDSLERL